MLVKYRVKCVVGLGNPGRKYSGTRHNAGYMVASALAGRFSVSFSDEGFCEVARAIAKPACGDPLGGGAAVEVLLVRPLTYMNASGQAVSQVLQDYPISVEDIIVVHDDMDLPLGKIRLRRKGSSGGHKGLESIAEHLGATEFARLKIGIGRPPEGADPVDYVLERFSKDETKVLEDTVSLSVQAALDALLKGIDWAMGQYNGEG